MQFAQLEKKILDLEAAEAHRALQLQPLIQGQLGSHTCPLPNALHTQQPDHPTGPSKHSSLGAVAAALCTSTLLCVPPSLVQ